jgi:hypothetical protein
MAFHSFAMKRELLDGALIYSTFCSMTMQNRTEEHPDREDTNQDDPTQLLTKIKVLMHEDPRRATCPFASLTEAIVRMSNIARLVENEGLLDHAKRFKQSRDITKSQVGTCMLDKFVEKTRQHQDKKMLLSKDD